MPARRRTFKIGRDLSKYEPLEFDINGEMFSCRPAIQGAALLEFVAQADSDSGGDTAAALNGFFASCMSESEYDRFQAYLRNPEIIIDMEEIGEIVSWLVEQYSERPTELPGNSQPGQSTSTPMSTDQHSYVESGSPNSN